MPKHPPVKEPDRNGIRWADFTWLHGRADDEGWHVELLVKPDEKVVSVLRVTDGKKFARAVTVENNDLKTAAKRLRRALS